MARFIRAQEIEHEIGPGGSFSLRVTDPEVHLRAGDGGTASARVTFEIRADSDAAADEIFERLRYQVRESSDALEVAEPKHDASGIGALARLFGGDRGQARVRVEVSAPAGCELRYDGVSAELTATGFRASQEYRTVSGDVVLDQAGGEIELKGVSSDVSLRAEEPLALLAINTVSGDVSAEAPSFGQLRASTVSGDLEIEGALADAADHRVQTVSGDLSLGVAGDLTVEVRGLSSDVDIRVPHRMEGSQDRRRYVIGGGGPQLLFSTMSGDVEVREPRRGDRSDVPKPPAPPAAPAPPRPEPVDQLAVLKALERGEIDVEEAARQLAERAADV